ARDARGHGRRAGDPARGRRLHRPHGQPRGAPRVCRATQRDLVHARPCDLRARRYAGRPRRDDHGGRTARSGRSDARRVRGRADPQRQLSRRYRSGMSGFETIEFERVDAVGWLRLNRPDKLNAFSILMWHEMRTLGRELHDDPELRALIVIGNGRAFSSGIDTTVFTGPPGQGIESGDDAGTRHADPAIDGILRAQDSYSWLSTARFPTIAAVPGYAFRA